MQESEGHERICANVENYGQGLSCEGDERWGGKGGVGGRWKCSWYKDALPPLRPFNPSQEDHLTLQGQLRKGRREFHPLGHLPKVSAAAKDSCHSAAFTQCLSD